MEARAATAQAARDQAQSARQAVKPTFFYRRKYPKVATDTPNSSATEDANNAQAAASSSSSSTTVEPMPTQQQPQQSNFHDYPVMRLPQMPKVEVHILPQ